MQEIRWRGPFSRFTDGIVVFFRLATNPRGRSCAICAARLKRSVWVCRKCGYDNWPAAYSPLPHPEAHSPETTSQASPSFPG